MWIPFDQGGKVILKEVTFSARAYITLLIAMSCEELIQQLPPFHSKMSRVRGYKTFFMLNSAENEICYAYKIYITNN